MFYFDISLDVCKFFMINLNAIITLTFQNFGKTCYTFFFNKQTIFDPRPKNCLGFSKKSPKKIVEQLFSRRSINFYSLNIQTF